MTDDLDVHIQSRLANIMENEPVNSIATAMVSKKPLVFGAGETDVWSDPLLWVVIGILVGIFLCLVACYVWSWYQEEENVATVQIVSP